MLYDFDKINNYFSIRFNDMNIQAEKLDILQTIMNSNDEGFIMDVKAFLSSRKADWFDELSTEQQKDVLEGISQADKGETVAHAEVVKLFGKWGLK
jgi:predicted transcriptional regulator